MKNIVLFIVILTVFTNCNCTEKEEKTINFDVEKETINNVLDNWHKNAAETNFEAYFKSMATDGIFIGTDASENWTVSEFKDFSKPYFDKGKAWSFTSIERNVYLNSIGDFAWFDELLDTHMGICRGSGVLNKTDSTWVIKHYVLSLTIPNDNINEVIKINKEKDSLFLNTLLKK